MEKTLATHKVIRPDSLSFDPLVYSKFKYGCVDSAVSMAKEMVKTFIDYDNTYNLTDTSTKLVIASPAHRRVPSAANILAENVYLMLNWYLHNKGYNPAEMLRVNRERVYEQDYATLSADDRKKLLDTEVLSLNERMVKDRTIIFVDDIRVTGVHENMLERVINTYPHEKHIFLYYAECNKGINPTIEDSLNKNAIDSMHDTVNILRNPHILNARMIKDLLRISASEARVFAGLVNNPKLFVNIVNNCIAEGYDKVPGFRQNFNYFKNIVSDEFNKLKETAGNQS